MNRALSFSEHNWPVSERGVVLTLSSLVGDKERGIKVVVLLKPRVYLVNGSEVVGGSSVHCVSLVHALL